MTRKDIDAERSALRRANVLFAVTVAAVTTVAALVLYATLGRAAGVALRMLAQ